MGLASKIAGSSKDSWQTPSAPPIQQSSASQPNYYNSQSQQANNYQQQSQPHFYNAQPQPNIYQQSRPNSYSSASQQQSQPNSYSSTPQQQQPQFNPNYNQQPCNLAVKNKIEQIVKDNRLEYFYPPEKLQSVIEKASSVDYNKLANIWKFPNTELAIDFAGLALYDIAIFLDDSGSMIFEEGGERVEDLKIIVAKVSEIATLFDDDGIVARPMNGTAEGNGITTAEQAMRFVGNLKYSGATPLGIKYYEKILKPFLYEPISTNRIQKPLLTIVVTDGAPTDADTFERNLESAVNFCRGTRWGEYAIANQIAQVGKDKRARDYVAKLDNHPVIGKHVDATSYFEFEQEEMRKKGVELTPELWLLKIMVGAIDKSYDELDE